MRIPQARPFVLLGILLSFTLAATPQQILQRPSHQSPGAIFTTDLAGQPAEVFRSKGLAYLSVGRVSGPPCSGEGLADGTYYFQVTNPSGTALLSKDSIDCRRVDVVSGMIASAPPSGHRIRNGPCGSKLVGLSPFVDSLGSSFGEYRLWVTPVSEYRLGSGFFGFDASSSKTDTFRVRLGDAPVTQTKISGTVFYDFNENGIYEPQIPGEVPLPGWKIQVDSNGVLTEMFADADGRYEFLRDMNSTHHILTSIAPPPGFIPNAGGLWLATTPTPVDIVTDVDHIGVDFGNLLFINTTQFARSKGYWQNQGRAELEACDPVWRIALNELCLRNSHTSPPDTAEETIFTVPLDVSFDEAFAQLGDFLVGDGASGVLAYILSTQFTAAILNVTCGPLHDLPTFIDQENNSVLVDLDHMIEHTHGMLCDPRSANSGPGGDEEWRAHITMCTDEWNGMNTTGDNTFTRKPTPGPIQY